MSSVLDADRETLRVYVESGRVKADAAKVCKVARQTFDGRLRAIANRWGIDPEKDDSIPDQPEPTPTPAPPTVVVGKEPLRPDDRRVLDLLRERGMGFADLKGIVDAGRYRPPAVRKPRRTEIYRIGIVSDTHLLDRACALDELHLFYLRCRDEGVSEIVHAGDLVTGQGVYRGQEADLIAWGFDEHLRFAARNYPQVDGMTTYWIGGNHEESYTKMGAGEFGVHLQAKRPDLVYLGMYDAELTLNGVKIGLHHGGGGASYALSYKLQKYVEKIGSGQKPQVYVLGHYHGRFYMEYRGIHCFLPACFQWANNFSVRLGLPNTVGGWIVEMEVEDNKRATLRSVKTTSVSYYAEHEEQS